MAQTKKRARETERDLIKSMNIYQKKAYYYTLLTQLESMFKYEGIDFRVEFLETPLLKWGIVAGGKDPSNDTVYIGQATVETIDAYGLPKEGSQATLTTRGGHSFQGIIGKDIIIGYNNLTRLPELMIEMYANLFHETDKSILTCLKKSRVAPMPVTGDEKLAKAFERLIDDIDEGNTKIVAYEGILDDVVEGKPPITMIELTEPKYTERLQYLSKFYDDVLRRFWTFYGHSLSSGSKMAQVNTMELEGYVTSSKIYPYILLEARREFVDKCNEAFDTNWSVDFSDAFKHLLNDVVMTEEVANDGSNSGSMGVSEGGGENSDQ